jgi:parallel beta-helix repeat protein
MKRKTLALCLFLLLSALILLQVQFSSVSAVYDSWTWESREPNPDLALPVIYIRSNGTVEGTDLIQRNGDTYTFTGDIGAVNWTDYWAYRETSMYSQGIIVEKDDIVIDGAGYNLTGSGHCGYITPFGSPPIINTANMYGIDVSERSNVTIKNLTLQLFRAAIRLQASANITVVSSDIKVNNEGLSLYHSGQLSMVNCQIHNAAQGIWVQNATRCLLYNNTFANNTYGIYMFPSHDGVTDYYSEDNVIVNNEFTNNSYAISKSGGKNNIIANNSIKQNSEAAIEIADDANVVCGNCILNNKYGIRIWAGVNNSFCRNQIANNTEGVQLNGGVNSIFYGNNFVDNENDVTSKYPDKIVQGSSVFWGKGSVGNYWSKYNGSDWTRDGKGDTPYVINSENRDNYPNMTPFNIDSASAQLPAWAQEKLRSLGIAVEEPTQETTPEPFPVALVIAASGASIAIIGVGLLVYFRKRKIKSGIKHT